MCIMCLCVRVHGSTFQVHQSKDQRIKGSHMGHEGKQMFWQSTGSAGSSANRQGPQ
jgi:hypothetical protein